MSDTRRMAVRFFLIVFMAGVIQAQPPSVPGAPVPLAALRYIDITKGSGEPAAPGKRYTVHYTGWLQDGTKFDSSVDRNQPLDFVQGRRQVISGWDMGFEGMKVGGKRRLFIPYQMAYGEAGTGPIPPKADLIFDVELLGVADTPSVAPAVDVLVPFIDLETPGNGPRTRNSGGQVRVEAGRFGSVDRSDLHARSRFSETSRCACRRRHQDLGAGR